jgi:hypothetical protein
MALATIAMSWNWMWAYGGDSGTSHSIEMRFGPSNAFAQTTLSMAAGDGLCVVGITAYRMRPDPGGPDQETDFQWNPNFGFPPMAYDPNLTYVRAELDVGAHQQGVASLIVTFFEF